MPMVKKTKLGRFSAKLLGWRMWIQTAFLLVWLDPLGVRMHGMCSPVFHCYACPLATFACPIGALAGFSSLHVMPYALIGMLLVVGGLVGATICGWVCPFGLAQDVAAKVTRPKFNLPVWASYFRYVVLIGAVLAIPYFFGEANPFFICRICPAGAVEAAGPNVVQQAMAAQKIVWPNTLKLTILGVLVIALFLTRRPWCKVLCPLGAIFGLFNRFSVFSMRLDKDKCTDCKLCQKLCEYGIDPHEKPNDPACVRCLECTDCTPKALAFGSIFGKHEDKTPPAKDQHWRNA